MKNRIWTPRSFSVLLPAIVFILFIPSLKFDFVTWDDPGHLLVNQLTRSLSWQNIVSIFTQTVNTTYIPLTILSFAVEYKFFGLNPFFYHLNNVLLHLMVTMLVYQLGMKLGLKQQAAFWAGLLFGIHPIHVESVVWVTERKDVLYAVFYLLALGQWLSYIDGKKPRHYLWSIILGILSMLAKPMAVSLPLTLLVLDWFKERKDLKKCLWEKIPFFIFCLGLAWLTHKGNYNALEIDGHLGRALLIFVWSSTFYIINFLFPFNLMPVYQVPDPINLSNSVYIFSLASFMICIALLIKFRREKWFMFAFMMYVVMIFFLWRFGRLKDLDIVADRFMYLPSIGFCFLIGIAIERTIEASKELKHIWLTSILIIFGILIGRSFWYSQIWSSNTKLWDFVISKNPQVTIAYLNRGFAHFISGQDKAALADYAQAIQLEPTKAKGYLNRGVVYIQIKKYDLALQDFNEALHINPKYKEAYFNRAVLYETMGKSDLAIKDYNEIVKIDATNEKVFLNRAVLEANRGNGDLAILDYTRAIFLNADFDIAYGNRGAEYYKQGKYQPAIFDFTKAIEINPSRKEYYFTRSLVFHAAGDEIKALEDKEAAQKMGLRLK